ncbi:MAG: GntR family transcriptional regulator [Opitutaceae bacterium]|nr:GntR family transcriptional regulator [Opitutaceae bacterium]
MLPFRIDFHSGEPVYEQVIYAAKKAILSGVLSPGERFPSVRSLSQELKINPNTAHKVVAALTAEGLLAVHPGVGTVVAPSVPGSAEDRAQVLVQDTERLVVEASRLGLTEEQLLNAVRKHWRKLNPSP